MSSNKVNGLCGYAMNRCKPSTVVARKVKGAIFVTIGKSTGTTHYFLAFQCGETTDRQLAYVYTCAEIRARMEAHPGWAFKNDGKWLLVYE